MLWLKSHSHSNFRCYGLKAIASEIALPVTMIFRKSLDTGCVPSDWRTANVSPIFKRVVGTR